MVTPAALKRYAAGLSGSCAALSRGSIRHKTQIYNRQTTSIILEGIGVQGDLRKEHEFAEDKSTLGGSFAGLCSIDRAFAGPTTRVVLKAAGVLVKTSQAKRRHEAETLLQAEERQRHAKRSRPTDMGSAARGKRPRSRSVLHEKGRRGCGQRPFSGRRRGQARLCHPVSLPWRSSGEERLEEASHQVLPALS